MLVNMCATTIKNMNMYTTDGLTSPTNRIAADLFYVPFDESMLYVIPMATPNGIQIISSDSRLSTPDWTFNSPIGSSGTIVDNIQGGSMLLVANNDVIISSTSASTFNFEVIPSQPTYYRIQSNGLYLTTDLTNSQFPLITTPNRTMAQKFLIIQG